MIDDLIHGQRVGEQLSNYTNDLRQAEPARELSDLTLWRDRVRDALAQRPDTALDIAEDAVRACPGEFELLLLAALAALVAGQSVRAHVFLKRHQKRYVPGKAVSLLSALAFAQQRQFSPAPGQCYVPRGSRLCPPPPVGSSAPIS